MKIITFDIETDGLVEDMTRIHCLAWKELGSRYTFGHNDQIRDGGPLATPIVKGVRDLEQADILVGHNIINFDIPAIRKVYPWFNPQGKIFDTMVAARLLWGDIRDLDKAQNRRFGDEDRPKDKKLFGTYKLEAFGVRLGMLKGNFGQTTDWKEWSRAMQDYCTQDVKVTEALYQRIQKEGYDEQCMDIEQEFAEIISRQMFNGWRLDVPKAEKLYADLSIRRQAIVDQIQTAIPPREEIMKTPEYHTWSSPEGLTLKGITKKDILDQAKEQDIRPRPKNGDMIPGPLKVKLHPFNPGSRDQIASYLTDLGWKPRVYTDGGKPQIDETTIGHLKYPHVDKFKEFLMVSKRISQLAEGETSILNSVHQDGRVYGYVNTCGTVTGRCTHSRPNVAQTPAKGIEYGEEFRSLYVPSEGYKLLGCDASGLELRCLAHYLAPYDGGAFAKEVVEGDVHSRNQQMAGLPTRDDAKTFIYAFLYGAGDGKIGNIIGKGAKAGKKIKADFYENMPAIKLLKDAVEKAAKINGYIKGWDGRIIKIRSPHSALNFLLQSLGAIIMKKALIIFDKTACELWNYGEDFRYVGNIHDEFQVEITERMLGAVIGELAVSSIKLAGETLNLRCPLDGEYKIGSSWAETH